MKKVKHIFDIFIHSFIPQDIFFPKLLHTRLQFSLRYYGVVISIFALLFTMVTLYQYSPSMVISYKDSIITALSSFPKNEKILINNGRLESNQDKPLFLWVYHDNQPLFVFMVHSKDIVTGSNIPQPLIYLGSDRAQIYYRGTAFVRQYDNSSSLSITPESIGSLIANIHFFFPFFMIVFYSLLIVGAPVAFLLGSTVLILLSSTVVFVLLRTFIPHIHLKKCVQAGLHGTHIPLFIVILLYFLFPSATNVFAISLSLFFVFTLVSVYEMYSKEISLHTKGR